MKIRPCLRPLILMLAALTASVLSRPLAAQTLYGSLVGNVVDASHASVPGAKVKITHAETNLVRETQTNADGTYTFPTIPPGTYEVEISREGFQTFTQRNIPVTINTTVRVDAGLVVGATSQSVEVSGQAALLQTDRADVRSEMTTQSLTNLPLPPGRNYEQLLVTVPGFTPPSNYGPLPTNPSRITTSTVNGASHNAVGVTIDGASNRSVWMRGGAAFAPGVESIETVNISTSSMDAEQGLAGSGSISVNIKSGTNNVHGTLFEYNTNNNLVARAFFLPANTGKPKFIQNQFGGTVGGPIKRNKLFYFLSWEATLESRLADNNSTLYTVPTAAIRSGDMSGSTTPIYDPATGSSNGTGRTPFPNNIIPLSRQSTIVTQGILPLLPQPNFPSLLTSNYYASGREYNRRQQIDSKVNYNASNKLTLSGRVSSTPFLVFSDSAFGNNGLQGPPLYSNAWIEGTTTGQFWNGSTQALYQVRPNLIVDTAFGVTLEDYNEVPPGRHHKLRRQAGNPGREWPKTPGFRLAAVLRQQLHRYGNGPEQRPALCPRPAVRLHRQRELDQVAAQHPFRRGTAPRTHEPLGALRGHFDLQLQRQHDRPQRRTESQPVQQLGRFPAGYCLRHFEEPAVEPDYDADVVLPLLHSRSVAGEP